MTAGLSQEDLVTMLRSQARKSTVRTSSYRGVSLLKQTGKWHAQINIGGKQVLMYYSMMHAHCMFVSCARQSAQAMWV